MLSAVKIKAIITQNLDGYNDKISLFFGLSGYYY